MTVKRQFAESGGELDVCMQLVEVLLASGKQRRKAIDALRGSRFNGYGYMLREKKLFD